MPARVRWRGKTTARGYGSAHQAERARRLLLYRPGDICPHCGLPITWPLPLTRLARSHIDLPHTADRTGYLPGLAHRSCNRRDGQAKTTAILNARRNEGSTVRVRTWQASRQW